MNYQITLRRIYAPEGVTVKYDTKVVSDSELSVDIDVKIDKTIDSAGEFALSCEIESPKGKDIVKLPCFFVTSGGKQ